MGEAGLGSAEVGHVFIIFFIIHTYIYIYTKDLKMHQTYSPSLIAINRLTRAQLLESIMLSHASLSQHSHDRRAGHGGH